MAAWRRAAFRSASDMGRPPAAACICAARKRCTVSGSRAGCVGIRVSQQASGTFRRSRHPASSPSRRTSRMAAGGGGRSWCISSAAGMRRSSNASSLAPAPGVSPCDAPGCGIPTAWRCETSGRQSAAPTERGAFGFRVRVIRAGATDSSARTPPYEPMRPLFIRAVVAAVARAGCNL
jgi:hypothetical protein